MLIIDDNKMKLLKMKEKLLEVSKDRRSDIFEDYRNIVIDIDNTAYNDLINEIIEVDYNNLSLEEQIEFFNKIIEDYTYLNELQCEFKDVNQKYSFDDIVLSDIDIIDIEALKERVSAIQGYLINSKNLENNKIELDKLNSDFILENKRYNSVIEQIELALEKLKNDMLLAEGRLQINNGEMGYTSIQQEFKNFNIDLTKIIIDFDLLNKLYNDAKAEYKENEETLSAATICYQNSYNSNDDIYNGIKQNTLKSKYKLILLSIVVTIFEKADNYTLAINKLNKMLDLFQERKKVLHELNIKHFIDPFDRININNYIESINFLGDNSKQIDNIKKTITYFTNIIDEMTTENSELLNKINTKIDIIKKNNIDSSDEYVGYKINDNRVYDDVEIDNNLASLIDIADSDDLVINIKDYSNNFMINRALEKSRNVINRVNQMFNDIPVSKQYEVSPELVIDSVKTDELVEDKNSFDENSTEKDITENEILDNTKDNIEGNIFIDDVSEVIDNDLSYKNKDNELDTSKDEKMILEQTVSNDIFSDDSDVFDTDSEDIYDDLNVTNKKGEDIFEEVVPFDTTPLFSDRYDDGIFEDKYDDLEDTMPDIFWDTSLEEKKKIEEESNILSFDEQVEELMGNTKARRKAA